MGLDNERKSAKDSHESEGKEESDKEKKHAFLPQNL